MNRKKWFLTAILIVGTVAAVPFVYGRPGHARGHHGFGDGMAMFGHLKEAQEELGLSDQQVDEIKTIFKAAREQNGTYREQLKGGIESIAQTLVADPNNIAAAQSLIDQQVNAERAVKTNLLNATAAALKVLNAEQRAKLGTMISERMARHREREPR